MPLLTSLVSAILCFLRTALTKEQLALLKRHTVNALIGYDADSAGQAAAMRGLQL